MCNIIIDFGAGFVVCFVWCVLFCWVGVFVVFGGEGGECFVVLCVCLFGFFSFLSWYSFFLENHHASS